MAQTGAKLLLIADNISDLGGRKEPPIVFSKRLSEGGCEKNGNAYERFDIEHKHTAKHSLCLDPLGRGGRV